MGIKLLVIDDEAEIRNTVQQVLTKMGYEVTSAESGKAGLELLEQSNFSLVLCDVMMGEMSGLKVLTEIKRRNNLLPVVMMSGLGTHEMVIEAMEKGAVDFIAKPVNFTQANKIIQKTLNPDSRVPIEYPSPVARLLREGYLGLLQMTNHLMEVKNPYLKGHSRRVADYSSRIARALKLADSTVEVINYAGLLHDIGKIGVSDVILSKPAGLSSSEWSDMKTHPALSRTIVESLQLFRAEEPLIFHHHEWFNGTGYPKGLKKDEIPLGARIISLADAYDAMTSVRPYRKPMDSGTAKDIIRKHRGIQFDPELTEVFLNVV